MNTLKNPQLALYAFHLRNELTQGLVNNASEIWEQLTALGEKLESPELSALKTRLLCYQDSLYQPQREDHYPQAFIELIQPARILPFSTEIPNLAGEIYPRRLHDTYAVELQFNYTGTVEVHELHRLNPNNYLSSRELIKPSLGQTLLFVAEPTELLTIEASKKLAQDCVEALLPKNCRPSLENTGQLFGGAFFEYDTQHENPLQNTHLLIWLKAEQNPPDKIDQYVLNLLNCQHKIKWVYYQSQYCNRHAQQLYSELRPKISSFNAPASLKQLEELLDWLPPKAIDYASHLSELNVHHTTIATNTANYQGWLNRIQQLTDSEDNLEFWQKFGDEECRQYQLQIQGDINSLQPGLPLFQQTVDTVQGLSQIETLKHEFNKQERLEYLVVGIASALESAAISAKVGYNHHLPEQLLGSYYSLITHFIGTHLTEMLTHLGIGVGFAFGAIGLLWVSNQFFDRFKKY
jgi:hypothetical protein